MYAQEVSKATRLLAEGNEVFDPNHQYVIDNLSNVYVFLAPVIPLTFLPYIATPSSDRPSLPEDRILATLHSSDSTTAPGISGWRVSFLQKIMHLTPNGGKLIASMINKFYKGLLSTDVSSFLESGQFTVTSKSPNSSPEAGFRPIGCEEVLERLCSKVVTRLELPLIAKAPHGSQYGIRTPGGSQSAISTLRLLREANPSWYVISFDSANAFHKMPREHVYQQLQSMFTNDEAKHHIWFLRRFLSGPVFGSTNGLAKTKIVDGFMQGPATSPTFFAVGLDSVLRAVSDSLGSNGAVIANVDDTHLIGTIDALCSAINVYCEKTTALSIPPNMAKTKVLCALSPATSDDEIRLLSAVPLPSNASLLTISTTVKILGSYIGIPDEECAMAIAHFDWSVFDRLRLVKDYQIRFQLLQQSICLFGDYLTRTLPPVVSEPIASKFDGLVTSIFAGCLNYPDVSHLTKSEWLALPTSYGGLGLRSLKDSRYADFLANLLSSWDTSKKRLQPPVSNSLVNWFRTDHDPDPSGTSLCAQIQHALNMVNHDLLISKSLLLGNIQNPAPSPFPKLLKDIVDYSPPLKLQHYFTKARTSFIYDRLFTAAGVEEKAHILSRTRPHAADFLQAPATSHTKQSNPEFSVSLCLYLYEDLQRVLGLQPGKKYMCPCLQSTFIPTARKQFSLSHAVNCCHDGSLIKRHNSVLYAMIRCAEVVGVTLTPEVRVSPANSLRFDAVGQGLLPNQSSNVLIECSIVNPIKSDYVNTASKNPFMRVRKYARLK
jgi:hypothetical protein